MNLFSINEIKIIFKEANHELFEYVCIIFFFSIFKALMQDRGKVYPFMCSVPSVCVCVHDKHKKVDIMDNNARRICEVFTLILCFSFSTFLLFYFFFCICILLCNERCMQILLKKLNLYLLLRFNMLKWF